MHIEHDVSGNRFVASIDGHEAVLEYRRLDASTLDYTRTFVPPQLRGRGIATELVRHALAYAAREELTVVPSCSFVAHVIAADDD